MLIAYARVSLLLHRAVRCAFLLIVCLCAQNANADYAMGMGYTPKYPANYPHFDYVNPDAAKGGNLVLSAFGAFDSFNPFLLKGIAADGLNALVFESLLEKSLDEPFSAYGLLADDFQLADDGLAVTFHLNPKARFANGNAVTAADVKFSFDTLMSKAAHPQYRIYFADVAACVVLDKLTLRFEFKRRNRELHLIVGEIPVFSRDWMMGKSFEETANIVPVGTGPYSVEDYKLGKTIRYRRNPHYWANALPVRKGMYNFDSVTYKYYRDLTVALEAFKAGEFDFFFENHSKRWARDHVGPKYDAGEIIKRELTHSNNAGVQGFAINTRRDTFKDMRVREALLLAFDFNWSNKNLFYNQYVRADSYFSNSELAASGAPTRAELKLLEPYRAQLPTSVFEPVQAPPDSTDPGGIRANLKRARDLLAEAGWTVQDGVLKNADGKVFTIDVLLAQKGFERIFGPYANNLKRLGIEMNYRTVDTSLYQRRNDTFDFDMVVSSFGQSMSPGNELRAMFHSESAATDGSRNLPGINSPVVDALVEAVIGSEDRAQLLTATHALDRVLLAGNYLVPNWYIDKHRVAYRNRFGIPQSQPLYYEPEGWLLKSWWLQGAQH